MTTVTCYSSGDATLPAEFREKLIKMNRAEETGLKNSLEKAIGTGELSEEDAIQRCQGFMNLWTPGQRIFPVLPSYIKELQDRIAASTAE
jgi:hypothetical protein